jgi:putative membrane protein
MRAVVRAHPRLAAFTVGYLAVFLVVGIVVGSDVAIPYVVLIAALIVLVCRLEQRYGLGTVCLWGLSLWGLGHLAGGIIPLDGDRTLYNAVLPIELFHFDRLVHFFGFGFATLACGQVLRRWLPGEVVTRPAAVLVVLAGLGVGAVNEIFEFAATLLLPETNVGGYLNTGWDLVFDLAGGLVAGWWLVRSTSRPRPAADPPDVRAIPT